MAMTLEQYLLSKLAEECLEVAHVCQKAIIFGLDDGKQHTGATQLERLGKEITDVSVILDEMGEAGIIAEMEDVLGENFFLAHLEKKRADFKKYLDYAIEKGRVEKQP